MGATLDIIRQGFFNERRNTEAGMFNIRLKIFIAAILSFLIHQSSTAADSPRYISLAPSTTEILFALGLDSEIAAVSSFCDYPEAAGLKEKVGTFSQPNIEKILLLKPSYVFCTGLEQAEAVAGLKRLNLNVYVSDPKTIDTLMKSILEIGEITGKFNQAKMLVERIKKEVSDIASKTAVIARETRPKVFIEIWHSPLSTAGSGSFVDELISIAGGRNIAFDVKRPYSIFSAEEVIRRDPDYIILAYMDKKTPVEIVKGRLGWGGISAVRNNRVYNDIDPNILLRPGPRIAEAILEIYRRIRPNE